MEGKVPVDIGIIAYKRGKPEQVKRIARLFKPT